jgi:type II secretory pathway component PulM
MIVEYWNSKTHNEKMFLSIGAVICVILIIYATVWLPIHSKKNDLLSEVQSQQELIQWMKQKAPLLKDRKDLNTSAQNAKEAFSVVEETFKNQSNLFPNLSITRNSDTKVSISFNNIAFDEFIKQMIMLKKKYNINIEEIEVNKLEQPGLVEGRVVLTSG